MSSLITNPGNAARAIGALPDLARATGVDTPTFAPPAFTPPAFNEPPPEPRPTMGQSPFAQLETIKLDSAIQLNRANTPSGVISARSAPRYSIREANELSNAQLAKRLKKLSPDTRPGIMKVLDIIDMPRNIVQNAITSIFIPEAKRMAEERGDYDQLGLPKVFGSDILAAMGFHNRFITAVGGFALDIVTDPLSFLGGPIGGIKSVGVRGTLEISNVGSRTLRSSINQVRKGIGVSDGLAKSVIVDTLEDGVKRNLLDAAATAEQKAQYLRDNLFGIQGKFSKATEKVGFGKFTKGGFLADDTFTALSDTVKLTETEARRINSVKAFTRRYANNGGLNLSGAFDAGSIAAGKSALREGEQLKRGGAELLHFPFSSKTVTSPAFEIKGLGIRVGQRAEQQVAAGAYLRGNVIQGTNILSASAVTSHLEILNGEIRGLHQNRADILNDIDAFEGVRNVDHGLDTPPELDLVGELEDVNKRIAEIQDEVQAQRKIISDIDTNQSAQQRYELAGAAEDLGDVMASRAALDDARATADALLALNKFVVEDGNMVAKAAVATRTDISRARQLRAEIERQALIDGYVANDTFIDDLVSQSRQDEALKDLIQVKYERASQRFRDLVFLPENKLSDMEAYADIYQAHLESAQKIAQLRDMPIRNAMTAESRIVAEGARMAMGLSDTQMGTMVGQSIDTLLVSLERPGLSAMISDVSNKSQIAFGTKNSLLRDIIHTAAASKSNAAIAANRETIAVSNKLKAAIQKSALVDGSNYDDAMQLALIMTEQRVIELARGDGFIKTSEAAARGTRAGAETLARAMDSGVLQDKELLATLEEVADTFAQRSRQIGRAMAATGELDSPYAVHLPLMLKAEAQKRAEIARLAGKSGEADAIEGYGGIHGFDPTTRRITNIVEFTDDEGKYHAFTVAEGKKYWKITEGEIEGLRNVGKIGEAKNAELVREGVEKFKDRFDPIHNAPGQSLEDSLQREARQMLPTEANAYNEDGRLLPFTGGEISGLNGREIFETNIANMIYAQTHSYELSRAKQSFVDLVEPFVVIDADLSARGATVAGETGFLQTGEEFTYLGDGKIRIGNRNYVSINRIDQQIPEATTFRPGAFLGPGSGNQYIPEILATQMLRLSDRMTPEAMSTSLAHAEKITSLFRTTTLTHPSWLAPNTIGNTIMVGLMGLLHPTTIVPFMRNMKESVRILAQLNAERIVEDGVLSGTARKLSTKIGKGVDDTVEIAGAPMQVGYIRQLVEEMGVVSGGNAGDAADQIFAQGSRTHPGLISFADTPAGKAYLQSREVASVGRVGAKKGTISSKLQRSADTVAATAAAKPTHNIMKVIRSWFELNAGLDNTFRLAAFMTYLDQGIDPLTAANRVREGLLNFGDLSSFEKNTLRPLIPFYCVPEEYKALTRSGWKTCDELEPGEEMLSYNSECDLLEWVGCEDVAVFDHDQDIRVLTNNHREIKCTDNHRWVCETKQAKERSFRDASELKAHTKVVITANLGDDVPDSMGIESAELLAWIITDGYHRWRGKCIEAMVYQTPKKYLEIVKRVAGGKPRKPHPETGCVCVPVTQDKLTDELKRILRDPKKHLLNAVLAMSRREAKIFYESAYLAEGCMANGATHVAAQKDHVRDAIQAAAFMIGRASVNSSSNGLITGLYVGRPLVRKQLASMSSTKEHYSGRVWCPKTKNHTWVMNTGNQILITGNTWVKASAPNILIRSVKDPKILSSIPKLTEGLETLTAGEDRLPQHLRPRWLQETMAIQMGIDPETRSAFLFGSLLPQEGALNLISGGLGAVGGLISTNSEFDGHDFMDGVRYLVSQTSPVIKAPIELATGTDVFSGRKIGVQSGEGEITLSQYLHDQVRPLKEFGRGGRAFRAFSRSTGEGIGRLALGGRIQPGLQKERLSTALFFDLKDVEADLRKAVRLAEKRGDEEAVVKGKTKLLAAYKAFLDKGGDPKDIPRWAFQDLQQFGQIQ